MTDYSSLQTKVDALKAMVAVNSITPTYLGSLLEDFLTQIQAIDMTSLSDDIAAAIVNASSALSKANNALVKADNAESVSSDALSNALTALEKATSAIAASGAAVQNSTDALLLAQEAKDTVLDNMDRIESLEENQKKMRNEIQGDAYYAHEEFGKVRAEMAILDEELGMRIDEAYDCGDRARSEAKAAQASADAVGRSVVVLSGEVEGVKQTVEQVKAQQNLNMQSLTSLGTAVAGMATQVTDAVVRDQEHDDRLSKCELNDQEHDERLADLEKRIDTVPVRELEAVCVQLVTDSAAYVFELGGAVRVEPADAADYYYYESGIMDITEGWDIDQCSVMSAESGADEIQSEQSEQTDQINETDQTELSDE